MRSTSPVEGAKKITVPPCSVKLRPSATAICTFPWNAIDGRVAADIGRTYLELSSRGAPAERAALLRTALTQLEQAERFWRQASLAPPLEHRRTEALAAIETDAANGRRLLASR